MALGRSLLSGVAGLLLMTGCASMGNTLAQDLAWERWTKCSHFRTIRLKQIRPDGVVFVEYSNGGADSSAWKECMQKAAVEQAQLRTAAAPPPPVAAASPASGNLPVWNRGDEWAYRYESPTGSGTYVWSVDREEAIDGIPHYVIKTGTRELFFRKSDFALTRETVEGAIVLKNTPPRLYYVWPMRVGQTWEQAILEERPVARQTQDRVDAVTVEAEETVTVPAGAFKTLKVVYRNKKTGGLRYEAWYSLELKQLVKLRENLDTGLRVRELIAFKFR
jgi:hypothetical protein